MLNYITLISSKYLFSPDISPDVCDRILNLHLDDHRYCEMWSYILTLYKYNVSTMIRFIYSGYPIISKVLQQYTSAERKNMFSICKSVDRQSLLPLVEYKDELIESGVDIVPIADIVDIPFTKSNYVPIEVWKYWLTTEVRVHKVIEQCYMYKELWIDISNVISRVRIPLRQLHNLIVQILLDGKFDIDIYNAWSKYGIVLIDDMLDAALIHWLAENKDKAFDYLCKVNRYSMSQLRNTYSNEYEALCESFESS